jgi:transcriptional regulator with XRE-family HTH domain
MDFPEKLQALRKERGMSQEDLAEAVGVSRQAVSKWESGQAYPEMDKLIALSDFFGISIDSLVKGNPDGGACPAGPQACGWRHPPWGCWHYEYKSKRRLFGMPLVHIRFGHGIHRARGVIAIGNIATGLVSIGVVSLGVVGIGALSLGLISIAGFALGLLAAAGGIAAGAFAFGGVAMGVVTLGGFSLGVYAAGGCAAASKIAVGGYASGHVAIGDIAHGVRTLTPGNDGLAGVSASQARSLIEQEYPGLWKPIVDWMTMFFR